MLRAVPDLVTAGVLPAVGAVRDAAGQAARANVLATIDGRDVEPFFRFKALGALCLPGRYRGSPSSWGCTSARLPGVVRDPLVPPAAAAHAEPEGARRARLDVAVLPTRRGGAGLARSDGGVRESVGGIGPGGFGGWVSSAVTRTDSDRELVATQQGVRSTTCDGHRQSLPKSPEREQGRRCRWRPTRAGPRRALRAASQPARGLQRLVAPCDVGHLSATSRELLGGPPREVADRHDADHCPRSTTGR